MNQEGMMAETLALHGMGTPVSVASLKQLVEDYERRLILAALERARGNQRRAARQLGCLPTTLNEKMRRLGLRACDRDTGGSGEREAPQILEGRRTPLESLL